MKEKNETKGKTKKLEKPTKTVKKTSKSTKTTSTTQKKNIPQTKKVETQKDEVVFKTSTIWDKISDLTSKIKRTDFVIMGILVLIYLIISIYHLGTLNTPKTYYQFQYDGDEVSLELSTVDQEVSKLRYYTGPEIGNFKIMISSDGNSYQEVLSVEEESVFAWEEVQLGESFRYIKFVSETPGSYLGEVQLYDKYGNKIAAQANDDQSLLIVDEANTVPVQISYMNSSYFDEIYFARSAYEYAHGIEAMEWVHPPLGKLIMMIPILLLGMSTFSYRIMGVLAGAIMIPVIYILVKRMFKNRKWAFLAGALMTFDSFHFAQSRMGTVDTFLVLFIMLSSLFMYQYIDLDKNAKFSTKLKNLSLSGLFIGCAISTKWTGLYVGAALALVFFVHLISNHLEERKIKLNKLHASRIILAFLASVGIIPTAIYYLTLFFAKSEIALVAVLIYFVVAVLGSILFYLLKIDKKAWKLVMLTALFFLGVPAIIYILCYVLFPGVYNYTNNSILGIMHQMKDMFHYHATLVEGHPFASKWYTWPLLYKPVWYYVGYFGGNLKATIVGIGNPAIWWFGVIATFYVIITSIFKRGKEELFILVFILCSHLPYFFIDRAMFMYHYYPTIPFIMLAIVAFVRWITKVLKSNNFYVFYLALVILMFIIFYPIVSGMVTTTDYIDGLKWFSSWVF